MILWVVCSRSMDTLPTQTMLLEQYILIEFIQGVKLSEIQHDLDDQEVISIVHQLTQLESQMMLLSSPICENLYLSRQDCHWVGYTTG